MDSRRLQLQTHLLSSNHFIYSFIEPSPLVFTFQHSFLFSFFTSRQHAFIKSYLVDMNNRFNKVFSSFISLYSKFFPDNRVINNFSNCFSFNLFNKHKNNNLKTHIQQFNNMVIKLSSIPSNTLIIMNISIKNNIAKSILYMYIHNNPITKTLHHMVYVTSIKAELFTIRYGINQAMSYNNISKIIVVINSIHAARKNI